jgi:hypothetical protein
LLSASAAGLHAPLHENAGATGLPNVPVTTRSIALSGTATGSYKARTIPDAGKFYTFTRGSGTIKPLGTANVTGNVALPGLLIMPIVPVVGPPTSSPSSVQATGQLTLLTPPETAPVQQGTLVLSLSAPSSDNATTLPPSFSYTITKATGIFRGDTGSGSAVITVKPVNPTTSPGPIIRPGGQEQGTFTVTFPLPSLLGGIGAGS